VRVPVPSGRSPDTYRVHVEAGALDRLGDHCARAAPAHAYGVIADRRVADLYGTRAVRSLEESGAAATLLPFPEGEASKSREEWARLTDRMLVEGLGRDAAVVALGGGVTGDLGGFVAATYMRGVPVVQVPTTLLAMVDSSVGGKTAVDTGAGKNLVGAFHHPALVLADPELLETLPREHRAAGLAEAVKAGAIRDESLFAWMERNAARLVEGETGAVSELVRRAVKIKAEVVAKDPEEAGRRAVLNFGHTVGHALERASGYEILHGQAVAAGMRVEARVGESLGVTRPGTARRLAALLDRCGQRDRPEEAADPAELYALARLDKKGREGRVRIVLLERIGAVARAPDGSWTHDLDDAAGPRRFGAGLRGAAESADSCSG